MISETEKTLTKKMAKGAGISIFGKITGRSFHVLGQIIIARVLGPAQFGIYAIGWNLLMLFGSFGILGLDRGVIHFSTKVDSKNLKNISAIIKTCLIISTVTGLLIAIMFYFIAPYLALSVFKNAELTNIIRLLSPAFLFVSIIKVASASTRIFYNMKYSFLGEDFLQPASNLLLLSIFLVFSFNLITTIIAAIISFLSSLALLVFFVINLFPNIFKVGYSKELVLPIIKYSVPTALAGMFTLFATRIDRLIIGYYLPESYVGLYQAISQVSILFGLILGSLTAIFTPMIGRLYHKGDISTLDNLFKISTKWGLYLCLPVYAILLLFPNETLNLIYGQAYTSASTPLIVLATAQIINVGTGATGPILIMTGFQKQWFYISFSMLLLNLITNIILIPRLHLIGAALASLLALSSLFGFGLVVIKEKVKIFPYDKRYFKGCLAFVVSIISLVLIKNIIEIQSIVILLFEYIFSFVAFFFTLFILKIDEEDRLWLITIKNKLLLKEET